MGGLEEDGAFITVLTRLNYFNQSAAFQAKSSLTKAC